MLLNEAASHFLGSKREHPLAAAVHQVERLCSIMQCSALCGVHGANLVLGEKIELRCGASGHSAETTSHEARRRGHLLLGCCHGQNRNLHKKLNKEKENKN